MPHDFSQPDYLYRLAKSGSSYDREVLAQAVTGLMHQNITQTERDLAGGILLRILQVAEHDLRQSLAQQLAHEPECPKELLEYLIYKNDFSIAEPVLRFSEALSDEDLIAAVKHFDQPDYWRTIAQRKTIGGDLAKLLLGTDDPTVFEMLVKNPGVRFNTASMEWLVGVAPHLPQLHEPLLARPEMTVELAARIYWHVSEVLRNDLGKRFKISTNKLTTTLEKIVRQRLEQPSEVKKIAPELIAFAIQMKTENRITSRPILDSLKQGDQSFFTCLWAALMNLDANNLADRFEHDYVTTLAILCRAAQVTRKDFKAMLLLSREINPKANYDMIEAVDVYDGLDVKQANQMVAAWQLPLYDA